LTGKGHKPHFIVVQFLLYSIIVYKSSAGDRVAGNFRNCRYFMTIIRFRGSIQKRNRPSPNGQFGASGGVVSCDTSQDFGSSPPVRVLPIPPPAAKLLKRYTPCGDSAYRNRLCKIPDKIGENLKIEKMFEVANLPTRRPE